MIIAAPVGIVFDLSLDIDIDIDIDTDVHVASSADSDEQVISGPRLNWR